MCKGSLTFTAVAILLIAGCSQANAGSTSTTDSSVSTTTTAETTSEPPLQSETTPTKEAPPGFSTPADAAIVYGTETAEAFIVGARVNFTLTERGTLTTDADGTRHVREAIGESTFSGNDPRITGSEAFTFNADWWGPSLSDSALTQWGTTVVTTADGTWEGTFSGAYSTATTDVITYWLEGTGAYDGQSMFMWTTETNTLGRGVNYALIFPGTPPVTGSGTPGCDIW